MAISPRVLSVLALLLLPVYPLSDSLTVTRYSASLSPCFYNVSVLSADETSALHAWIVWKNKMPRYTFLLDKVERLA